MKSKNEKVQELSHQVIVVTVRDDDGVEFVRELGDVARRRPVPPRTHVLARTGAEAAEKR